MKTELLPNRNVLDSAASCIEEGRHEDGFQTVMNYLMEIRDSASWDEWKEMCVAFRSHRVHGLFRESPLHDRAFQKPRGYAGDACTLDYFYGLERYPPQTSFRGRQLSRCQFDSLAGRAFRSLKKNLTDTIDEIAGSKTQCHVLSVGCGYLRELADSAAWRSGSVGRFVALDQDGHSLDAIRTYVRGNEVETIRRPVESLIGGKTDLSHFDLIYAAGLYEYLTDAVVGPLNGTLFEMLGPGGILLTTNLAPNLPDKALMEAVMDWWLIFRNEEALEELTANIPRRNARKYFRDSNGCMVFQKVYK